jgi:hypothetical protein
MENQAICRAPGVSGKNPMPEGISRTPVPHTTYGCNAKPS